MPLKVTGGGPPNGAIIHLFKEPVKLNLKPIKFKSIFCCNFYQQSSGNQF